MKHFFGVYVSISVQQAFTKKHSTLQIYLAAAAGSVVVVVPIMFVPYQHVSTQATFLDTFSGETICQVFCSVFRRRTEFL